MANKPKFTKREFRDALDDCKGHIDVVAGRLNISRSTVYRYLERHPDLKLKLAEERTKGRDLIVELARTNLIEGLENKSERMTMFALRHYDLDGVAGAFDIDSLFSQKELDALIAMNIKPSQAVAEFVDILRKQSKDVTK